MAEIITKQERARGCGFRKGGGMYLVNDGAGRSCGRIPLPLHVCPTCSQGIKPARGFTWVDGKAVLAAAPACTLPDVPLETLALLGMAADKARDVAASAICETCSFNGLREGKVGLMWVGGKYYPTPESFKKEAVSMGLSKRIAQIPKELVVGTTWVWLAHRETIPAEHKLDCRGLGSMKETDIEGLVRKTNDGTLLEWCNCGAKPTPGVFHAFVPTRIEYVVKGDESDIEIEALAKRGLTLVKVERIGENGELFPDTPTPEASDGDSE